MEMLTRNSVFQQYTEGTLIWVPIDSWLPQPQDIIMSHTKNTIYLPVSEFLGCPNSRCLNNFMMTPKRCYNSDKIREHICSYINYFEKYYDMEHELLFYYCKIKAAIDLGITDVYGNRHAYTIDDFYSDIKKYILSDSMYNKVWYMILNNYKLNLVYRNKTNEALQYNNRHGEYLMEISVFQNILIPLIMHFIYKNKIHCTKTIDNIILYIYDFLFNTYKDQERMAKRGLRPADVFSKLYETVSTTIGRDYKSNTPLWEMNEIRGYNIEINSNDVINIVIMQIMPKYKFNENLITFNITGIRNNIKYTVTGIKFEYDLYPISSSKRDGEDNTSQLDKYEAHLNKIDEGLVLQNTFRAKKVMEFIINEFGSFNQDEIRYYRNSIIKGNRPLVNAFQMSLIQYLFYKYFGDTNSINSINANDYVILMIAAKRILLKNNMKILSYIVAGNFIKISTRMSLCKKEMMKLEVSPYYKDICIKYNNDEKLIKRILSLISTILSSTIMAIDYYDKDIDGKQIITEPDILIDEILMFISLI